MFFDGQNLEAETEEEVQRLLAALKSLGEVVLTENVDSHTVEVAGYTFLLQQGYTGGIAMSGIKDASDEKLYDLYLVCGGEPDEDEE